MARILVAMVLAVLFTSVSARAAEFKYVLDKDNTKIEWTGTKPDGKHSGSFGSVSGSASLADNTGLVLEVNIDTTSLTSDNNMLTQHLKSPDFFAVKDHPKAKFVSTKVVKADKGYTITGDLTLLGKTKSISFPAEMNAGDELTIKAAFTIDRQAFGMAYGKGKIDDNVEIRIAVKAKK